MNCPNSYQRCYDRGHCDCNAGTLDPQTTGTLIAYAFIATICAIFIVFVAFGVAAFQIIKAKKLYNQQTGKSTITGLTWLYLSPLSVGLSAFLVAFAASLFVQFTPFELQGNYPGMMMQIVIPMVIFSAGMIITLITFIIKNWAIISSIIKESTYLHSENKQTSFGIAAILLITLMSIPASVIAASVFKVQGNIKFNNRLSFREGDYKQAFKGTKGTNITIKVEAVGGNTLKLYQTDANDSANSAECVLNVMDNNTSRYLPDKSKCTIVTEKGPIEEVSFWNTKGKLEMLLDSNADVTYPFAKQ